MIFCHSNRILSSDRICNQTYNYKMSVKRARKSCFPNEQPPKNQPPKHQPSKHQAPTHDSDSRHVPIELVLYISNFVNPTTLVSLACVCRSWYRRLLPSLCLRMGQACLDSHLAFVIPTPLLYLDTFYVKYTRVDFGIVCRREAYHLTRDGQEIIDIEIDSDDDDDDGAGNPFALFLADNGKRALKKMRNRTSNLTLLELGHLLDKFRFHPFDPYLHQDIQDAIAWGFFANLRILFLCMDVVSGPCCDEIFTSMRRGQLQKLTLKLKQTLNATFPNVDPIQHVLGGQRSLDVIMNLRSHILPEDMRFCPTWEHAGKMLDRAMDWASSVSDMTNCLVLSVFWDFHWLSYKGRHLPRLVIDMDTFSHIRFTNPGGIRITHLCLCVFQCPLFLPVDAEPDCRVRCLEFMLCSREMTENFWKRYHVTDDFVDTVLDRVGTTYEHVICAEDIGTCRSKRIAQEVVKRKARAGIRIPQDLVLMKQIRNGILELAPPHDFDVLYFWELHAGEGRPADLYQPPVTRSFRTAVANRSNI